MMQTMSLHHENSHVSVVDLINAWTAAVTEGDEVTAVSLSDPEVVLVGPKGRATGHQTLREWVGNAGIVLENQRFFGRGEAVVAAQVARWPKHEGTDGAEPVPVATAFRVSDGRITRVARHDNLADALADAGLSPADALA